MKSEKKERTNESKKVGEVEDEEGGDEEEESKDREAI